MFFSGFEQDLNSLDIIQQNNSATFRNYTNYKIAYIVYAKNLIWSFSTIMFVKLPPLIISVYVACSWAKIS